MDLSKTLFEQLDGVTCQEFFNSFAYFTAKVIVLTLKKLADEKELEASSIDAKSEGQIDTRPAYISVDEATKRLNVSVGAVHRYARRGLFESYVEELPTGLRKRKIDRTSFEIFEAEYKKHKNTEPSKEKGYYTTIEIANIVDLPSRKVHDLLEYGIIPGCSFTKALNGRNSRFRVDPDVFEPWYEKHWKELDKYRTTLIRRRHKNEH